MRIGQKARLTFDTPSRPPIDGRIDSLFTGAQFSHCTTGQRHGNFTKVVQRIQ